MQVDLSELIAWLRRFYEDGATHIDGADTYEPPWPSNLCAIIHKLEERLASNDITFPEDATNADCDRILLRAVLERGRVNITTLPGTLEDGVQGHAVKLGRQGLFQAFDRLGQYEELSPAGHRYLAAIDPSYVAPAGLFMMDRWHDPEALVCQAAALLAGKLAIKRETDNGTEGRTVSPEAAAMLIEEAKRLAGK